MKKPHSVTVFLTDRELAVIRRYNAALDDFADTPEVMDEWDAAQAEATKVALMTLGGAVDRMDEEA